MKWNHRILLFAVLLTSYTATAQYTMQGKIEYERKVNNYSQLEGNEWMERLKDQVAKFSVTYFELAFNNEHTLYKLIRESENTAVKMGGFSLAPAMENTVLTDLDKQQVKSSKEIYGQKFLETDSVPKLQWKITNELRTIANYKCRKAISIICDSVYVVAFYTEDIPISSGPEMFGGLPGMILEIGIPRLHTTWAATKVDIVPPVAKDFVTSEKGKVVTHQQLYETLQSSLKDWGKLAQRYIWWSVL